MLSCAHLDFSYGSSRRLKNVSFSIEAPGLLSLFGHNGAGKSTLLKMLGGSLPIDKGEVRFFSEMAVSEDGYVSLQQRKFLGVLFQGPSSDEKLSALDNLVYAGSLMGLSHKKALEQAHKALVLANLTDRAQETVKKFSAGMRRRLELYRTFLHEPRIVLLDEPTSGLDVRETANFFAFIKDYQRQHRAVVVMSSHHPEELLNADMVLMLKDGEILAVDEPHTMLRRLDYFCCSFLITTHDEAASSLEGRGLFDQCFDEKAQIIAAKILAKDLDALFLGPILEKGLFRGFSIKKPSLGDVYDDLLKKRESRYGEAYGDRPRKDSAHAPC